MPGRDRVSLERSAKLEVDKPMTWDKIDTQVPFHSPSNWEAVKDQVGPKGKVLTEAYQMTVADHDTTFFLDATTEFTTNLPAVADAGVGWRCKVVVKSAPSSADYVVQEETGTDTNVIKGGVAELEVDTGDDGPSSTGATNVNFKDGVAVAGDFVEFVGDGVNWHLTGVTKADGGVTIT